MGERERGKSPELGSDAMSLKHVAIVLAVVFVVALAIVVGKQMSSEAMAVVVGVACGVAAGIPTSLLLLMVLTRRERQRLDESDRRARQGTYPPVVVIQGSGALPLQAGPAAGYWPEPVPGPTGQRRFHVVGDDDLHSGEGHYSGGW
jgi:hypothetical protein